MGTASGSTGHITLSQTRQLPSMRRLEVAIPGMYDLLFLSRFLGLLTLLARQQWWNYTETTKTGLQTLAYAHMDALRDFFFWTCVFSFRPRWTLSADCFLRLSWKTGYSNTVGNIANPLWNYQSVVVVFPCQTLLLMRSLADSRSRTASCRQTLAKLLGFALVSLLRRRSPCRVSPPQHCRHG